MQIISSWSSNTCSLASPPVSRILVRLIWMVFKMGGRWPYICFLGYGFQDLFNMARSILVQLPLSFFSMRSVSVHVLHPYSKMDTTAAWKKMHFILSDWSDFHMTDNLSIPVYVFPRGWWTCPLVSENHHFVWIKAHVLRFVCIHVEAYATWCTRSSAWAGVFTRSATSFA